MAGAFLDDMKSAKPQSFDFGLLQAIGHHLPCFVYQLRQSAEGDYQFLYISDNCLDIVGLNAADVMADSDTLISRIHPDDRAHVFSGTTVAVKENLGWQAEFRVIKPNQEIVWVEAFDVFERNPDGSVVFYGYAMDITKRKNNEIKLAASEADFRALVESANDIIYTIAPDTTITYVSPTWQDILGHHLNDVVGKTFDNFIFADDLQRCYDFMEKLISTRQKQSGLEYRIRDIHGNLQWHTTNASPIFNDDGTIKKCMGIAREITDQKTQQQHIQQLAHYDVLTQLPNRSLFFDLLDHQLKVSQREGYNLALLFIDLDFFKPVNDQHGHAVGDEVLAKVAKRIGRVLRQSDLIGRIGGDEFLVALPGFYDRAALEPAALRAAEKVRNAICETIYVQDLRIELAASIGIAFYPLHSESISELTRLADRAMYDAKRQGKNKVAVFNPIDHQSR